MVSVVGVGVLIGSLGGSVLSDKGSIGDWSAVIKFSLMASTTRTASEE